HRTSPSFFQRCVIEEGIGSGVQNLLSKRRRLNEIASNQSFLASLDGGEKGFQALNIHGFFETVPNRLVYQRVVGNLYVTALKIFRAGYLVRENGRKQLIRIHPLQLSRNLFAASSPHYCKRASCVPSPSDFPHWSGTHRLDQQLAN